MANRTRNNGIYLMLSDDELKVLEKNINYQTVKACVNLLWSVSWNETFLY